MADIRREKFNKQGQIARELATLALADIDDALAEHNATILQFPLNDSEAVDLTPDPAA